MRKILISLLLIIFSGVMVYAQQTINGTIKDHEGNPLSEVNVTVKGTDIKTITNLQGEYSLEIPGGQKTLVFQKAGYQVQEVNIDKNVIDIVMTPDMTDLFDLSIEELMDIEITTASKSAEKLSEASSSASVFTKKEINNMGVRTVEDLLNYVPGYCSTRDNEQGNTIRIGVRGKGSALSESVLFLVNGHRINDLYSGGVSIINRLIATENIEQIEVIRGPGSALYGSNAFLGVVNIVTSQNANEVNIAYGTENSREASVSFSGKNKGFNVSGLQK
ncbi:MAG: TonB-dependent receptor plug domain-containing protein [Chloroflexia bacterium]|nr:TonB-dependent receptor plug domain-containing protein [Chloroflexia bacterium]